MARDLYDATPGFRDAMEPEAREIDITRNHAEHKYLKVHDDLWPELSAAAEAAGTMPADAAFSIGCGMLVQRTLAADEAGPLRPGVPGVRCACRRRAKATCEEVPAIKSSPCQSAG